MCSLGSSFLKDSISRERKGDRFSLKVGNVIGAEIEPPVQFESWFHLCVSGGGKFSGF